MAVGELTVSGEADGNEIEWKKWYMNWDNLNPVWKRDTYREAVTKCKDKYTEWLRPERDLFIYFSSVHIHKGQPKIYDHVQHNHVSRHPMQCKQNCPLLWFYKGKNTI